MIRINEVRVNKLLTIIIIILTIFILICAYFLKNIREKESNNLEDLKNKIDNTDSIVYEKEEFGSNFDFSNINNSKLLDENDGIKFIKYNNIYYIIDDNNTYDCEYLYDINKEDYNYRYCVISDELKIDFSNLKFVKNND